MLLVAVALVVAQAAPEPKDAAATGVQKPKPRLGSWRSNDDYPSGAFRRKEFGTVRYRADIDATGHLTACHIMGSSGYSELDEQTCRFLATVSFTPARDATGKDIAYPLEGTFNWSFPGGARENPVSAAAGAPLYVDIALKVVPKNYANPVLLRLVFDHDKVKACHVELSSGNQKLDAVACAQTSSQAPTLAPVRGLPPADSRTVSVRFEASN